MNLKTTIQAYDVSENTSAASVEVPLRIVVTSEDILQEPSLDRDDTSASLSLGGGSLSVTGSSSYTEIQTSLQLEASILKVEMSELSQEVTLLLGIAGYGGGGGISDAPKDGNTYGRKDGAWVEVETSGGIEDAPSDNNTYARKNGEWVGLPEQITTDDVVSSIEIDPETGKPKTLQKIIKELEASSGKLTIDSELSDTSENPVQNKVLANILIFS